MTQTGPEGVQGGPCLVGNPLAQLLYHHQDYFYSLAQSDPSPAELYDAIRMRLGDEVLVRAAGIDPDIAKPAAVIVHDLSRVFPPAVAEIMKSSWIAAYEGARPFSVNTGEPPPGEKDDFAATGRVRVVVDFDEEAVSMTILHTEDSHAAWYAPELRMGPPPEPPA